MPLADAIVTGSPETLSGLALAATGILTVIQLGDRFWGRRKRADDCEDRVRAVESNFSELRREVRESLHRQGEEIREWRDEVSRLQGVLDSRGKRH